VSRIREAYVRALPDRGPVNRIEFARDTLTLRTFAPVIELYAYSGV
jgi:hypothetical protein